MPPPRWNSILNFGHTAMEMNIEFWAIPRWNLILNFGATAMEFYIECWPMPRWNLMMFGLPAMELIMYGF